MGALAVFVGRESGAPSVPGHPSSFLGQWGCLLWSVIARESLPADAQSLALRLPARWASLASSFCPFNTRLEVPAGQRPLRQDSQQKRPTNGKQP